MKLRAGTTLLLTLLLPLLSGATARGGRVPQSDVKSGRSVPPAQQTIPIQRAQNLPLSPGSLPGVSQDTSPSVSSAAAANYAIDWYSMNGGGAIDVSSASYKMGLSVGQSVAGEASSTNYKASLGFWYGTGGGCSCPSQGDVNPDLVVDVFDVIQEIAIAFSGGTDITDPGCPTSRGDVNNDTVVDVFDVIQIIAVAFSGGSVCNPCTPGVPAECP